MNIVRKKKLAFFHKTMHTAVERFYRHQKLTFLAWVRESKVFYVNVCTPINHDGVGVRAFFYQNQTLSYTVLQHVAQVRTPKTLHNV